MAVNTETIIELEKKMDQAFAENDVETFRALVDPDALMVVGGGRTSGLYYSYAVADVKIKEMNLSDFQVIPLGEDAALVHSTMEVVGGEGTEDLTGRYLVSSVWVQKDGAWKLVFNQDSQAVFYPAV